MFKNLSKKFTLREILFYIIFFFFILAFSILFNRIDNDFWARLIQGNCVFNLHHPCFYDFLSYTGNNKWLDPEWITSGFFYIVCLKYKTTGITLLKAIFCYLILILTILAQSAHNRKKPVISIEFFIFIVLMCLTCGILTSLRCQAITFIFCACWLFLLEKIRFENKTKLLFLLPFISILWLNLHGGVICAVGILFLYAIGEFLNKKPSKQYFIALLFCLACFTINPFGFNYIPFMLKSAILDRSWIAEWSDIFAFKTLFYYCYIPLVFLAFFSYIFRISFNKITYKNIDKTKIILMIVVSFLGIKNIKHFGLTMVVLSIYSYDDICFVFYNLINKIRNCFKISQKAFNILFLIKDYVFLSVIFILVSFIFLTIPINSSLNKTYLEVYPAQIVEFIKVNKIKGNLLAPFGISSYISYKLYPEIKIYMDGREEQSYDDILIDYNMFFYRQIGKYPNLVLDKYPPDLILIPKFSPLYNKNSNLKDFTLVYKDSKYALLIKNNQVRKKYSNSFKNEKMIAEQMFDTDIKFGR